MGKIIGGSWLSVFVGVIFALTTSCAKKVERGASEPIPSHETALKRHERHRDTAQFRQVTPDPLKAYQPLLYDLSARYDWKQHLLTGTLKFQFKLTNPGLKEIALDTRISRIQKITDTSGNSLPYRVDDAKHLLTIEVSTLASEVKTLVIDYDTESINERERDRGLKVVPARKGDPINVPVLYTHSEPQDARTWMPCKDDPKARAKFAMAFEMPESQKPYRQRGPPGKPDRSAWCPPDEIRHPVHTSDLHHGFCHRGI